MTTSEAQLERPQTSEEEAPRCPTCGTDLPLGARFCLQCGRALAATLAPAPGDLVTIVFVDLNGFSAFSSRAEDEEVRDLIRSFHSLVREQVERHAGFEVKQLGDGFMLAFSNPARAIACAADVQRALDAETGPLAETVRVCAGVNSGDAVREGDDFFGHTVNVASRITSRADGGQVLVSEATRVLAGHVDGVRFANAGRRRLRGLGGRHRLYEVVWWDESRGD